MEPWAKLVWSILFVISFIWFYWFYRFYVSLGDIWCCLLYFIHRLVTCSYHLISYMFPAWYRLSSLYLLLHAGAHDTVYNAYLWLGFIDTHVLISARHLAFALPLAGSCDSSGSSCPGFGAWSVWILPVADQSGAAKAWIPSRPSEALSFQAPFFSSRVFLLWLWASICTWLSFYLHTK